LMRYGQHDADCTRRNCKGPCSCGFSRLVDAGGLLERPLVSPERPEPPAVEEALRQLVVKWRRQAQTPAIRPTADECADELDALLVDRSSPSGWRDIATAPKDGKAVLGWHPRWSIPEVSVWLDGPRMSEPGWHSYQRSYRWSHQPTHWQPLPSPPLVEVQRTEEMKNECLLGTAGPGNADTQSTPSSDDARICPQDGSVCWEPHCNVDYCRGFADGRQSR
jgi:hypothetical protein